MAKAEYERMLNSKRYSTGEIKTGKTWINGKTVYRKVVVINAPDLNSYMLHNIANIDEIVNVEIMLKERV